MGEIRTKMKLTNWFDLEQVSNGAITEDEVRWIEVEGVVDTGAVKTVLPVAVADAIGISGGKRTVAQFADGSTATVETTKPMQIDVEGRTCIDTAMILGDEVLIGQITLESTDLLADCTNRRLVPNPEHPHQPVFKVR
jgi:hypothetical protein